MNKQLLMKVLERLCVRYPEDGDLLGLKEKLDYSCRDGGICGDGGFCKACHLKPENGIACPLCEGDGYIYDAEKADEHERAAVKDATEQQPDLVERGSS
ncbi:hypothetical protein [Endozoicomonas atrinae]|uniref:hypothetical protein n=1 Tax=Endozoicomonas atrinae TaxID=1333660 RepID=UPI000824A6F9|nr:hypothetical protein [Endozoicomonas atrinae]